MDTSLPLPPPAPAQSPDFTQPFDVLVVGAGAAGLYSALCLPPSFQVGLITKDTLSLSASDWAQGGIAAAIAPDDSTALHITDTIKAGAGLCDPTAVEFLAENASDCIRSLVEMGVAFDRHDGELALTLEAAHSRRRVLHAADTTGRAVVNTLTAKVLERKNIQVFPQTFALSLWIDPQTQRCQGISLIHQGQVIWVRATAVVLATGGGGQVFAQTTNPELSTGDGVAIAWRAGALLRDLEFIQFHPTALSKPGAPRFLISEAVRGEGAHLVDTAGQRFAFEYHPAGELAPRDVVSRAIFNHLQQTESDPASAHVLLDLRPIPVNTIRHRFPNIIQVSQQWGVDVFQEPIPVTPAAHYWMGGVVTDTMSRTSIPGLYAVGETTSTGVHGANRLASNSLLECLVYGAQLAHLELGQSNALDSSSEPSVPKSEGYHPEPTDWQRQQAAIATMRQELPRLMWQSAGICREETTLLGAIAQVETWQAEFAALPLSQFLLNLAPTQAASVGLPDADLAIRTWSETQNLLDVGYLILKSALFRTESRGGHYRVDFPQPEPHWQAQTLVQDYHWWTAPISALSN
ncbi:MULTISPECIES: L-aspartate oxidase [Trichocoleus]|uniref:L-aspartate oxidase n=1 Tax=Trichocoleus TaxID=450526 RepID=UPI001689893B|nr:L-aspartate oxidase [Trichocoleus sp. FACHB-46]MBD1861722.1 L-aspartate oxidase [Trichocoleus sp. FACHB-46]